MAKELNDTQRLILTAAAAREDLRALPLPETLRAPPHIVTKAVTTLIKEGLLAEITALPDDQAWTASEVGGRVTLIATTVGLAAIGVDPEAAPAATSPDEAPAAGKGRGGDTTRTTGKKAARRDPTAGGRESKQNTVIGLLRRQEGASVEEMMEATSWQAHSVRGFMSGALKRRLKLDVVSEKDAKTGERRYYIAAIRP